MTITITDLHDEHEDAPDEPVRPFEAFCPVPSPLSGDVDEIVAYMLLIGDRRRAGVSLERPTSRSPLVRVVP